MLEFLESTSCLSAVGRYVVGHHTLTTEAQNKAALYLFGSRGACLSLRFAKNLTSGKTLKSLELTFAKLKTSLGRHYR